THLSADARQRLREFAEGLELVGVTQLAPARVVAILLAPARIAASRLQVAALVAADPDVGPGGRNRQRPEAVERFRVPYLLAFRIEVFEALPGMAARESLLAVAGIAQATMGGRTIHGNNGSRSAAGSSVRSAQERFELFGLRVEDVDPAPGQVSD